MSSSLQELCALASHAQNRRTETGIPRVAMVKGAIPEHDLATVYDPMINLILQGSKTLTVGGTSFHYDPATYFVLSVNMPAAGVVHPAETGEPYLAVSLTLDASILATMLSELPRAAIEQEGKGAFSVAPVTPDLLDAWVRMMRLMRSPSDIAALAPAYEREILYRVLQGPMGWMLRDIAWPDSALSRVSRALQRLRTEYAEPLSIDELAAESSMSVSAFHRHFKALTSLSPLQYQKQVRLLRARALLASTRCSVTSAAVEVGYASPTQFSREYARAFGLPPARDVERISRSTNDGSTRGRASRQQSTIEQS